MDTNIILDTLFSTDNLYGTAKLSDIGNGSIYYQSLVTVPGLNTHLLDNTYYVIFKIPMNPQLFTGNSYKEISALSIKDYVYKISPAKKI